MKLKQKHARVNWLAWATSLDASGGNWSRLQIILNLLESGIISGMDKDFKISMDYIVSGKIYRKLWYSMGKTMVSEIIPTNPLKIAILQYETVTRPSKLLTIEEDPLQSAFSIPSDTHNLPGFKVSLEYWPKFLCKKNLHVFFTNAWLEWHTKRELCVSCVTSGQRCPANDIDGSVIKVTSRAWCIMHHQYAILYQYNIMYYIHISIISYIYINMHHASLYIICLYACMSRAWEKEATSTTIVLRGKGRTSCGLESTQSMSGLGKKL